MHEWGDLEILSFRLISRGHKHMMAQWRSLEGFTKSAQGASARGLQVCVYKSAQLVVADGKGLRHLCCVDWPAGTVSRRRLCRYPSHFEECPSPAPTVFAGFCGCPTVTSLQTLWHEGLPGVPSQGQMMSVVLQGSVFLTHIGFILLQSQLSLLHSGISRDILTPGTFLLACECLLEQIGSIGTVYNVEREDGQRIQLKIYVGLHF